MTSLLKLSSRISRLHPSRLLRTAGFFAPFSIQAVNTINQDEIAHFSKLSSEWWDERGEFEFLHKMNPVRMQFIRDKLLECAQDENPLLQSDGGDIIEGLSVLDVGCGGGLLSESLARMGANTLGIDASESNIKIASLHASADPSFLPSGRSNLLYRHASAENLLSEPKRYDIVCSMEVIEHVDNPSAFLTTCAELVKPGGHLFLSTISRTPLAHFLTIFMAEVVLRKVSKGTHTYSKFVKPSELVQFFSDHQSPLTKVNDPSSASSLPRPWISASASRTYLPRLQAELRGLIYNPLQARWHLAPRDAWGALECNYIFWVRKPMQ